MADKVYVNGFNVKAIKTQYGNLLKVGIKSELLIAFLAKHTGDKGYCNIDILERKEPDQYGNTHYAILNEYKKEGKPMSANQIPDNYKGQGEKEEEGAGSGLPF